jgi:PAS domain-containing protein
VAQQPIELILLKQVATHLVLPIFLVNPEGDLLFYNEPAEQILGRRFDETGEMSLEVWSVLFKPESAEGDPLAPERLPLVMALSDRKPAHGSFDIVGLDGKRRSLLVTAIPIIGLADRFLGAVALFWEAGEP